MLSGRIHLLSKIFPWLKVGDIGAGNYVDINSTQGIVLKGTTTCYKDVHASIAVAKVPAANAPVWTAFTAHTSAYTFRVNDHMDLGTMEYPHECKEFEPIEVHIHGATQGTDTNIRKVKFVIYYTYGVPDSMLTVFGAEVALTAELTIPANTPTNTPFYLSMGTIPATDIKIGTQIKTALYRIAGTGTEPTLDPYLGQVSLHCVVDTMGSASISTK